MSQHCFQDLNEYQRDAGDLADALASSVGVVTERVSDPTVEILVELADLQCVLNQAIDVITSRSSCATFTLQRLEIKLKELLDQAENAGNLQPG